MEIRFVDTTFRDGSQSLWACGLRTGMMEAVADDMDQAGFDVIEAPVLGLFAKKFVRDLREDFWEMARMLARQMPRTQKSAMLGNYILPFELSTPRAIVELYHKCLVDIGVLQRAQTTCNTLDQIDGPFEWVIPMFRDLGLQVVIALSYTISPRHTDEHYAQKTRDALRFKPDAIYLKDQGGLLTVDRLRTLLPVIMQNAESVPVELHSHCTTGLAGLVYLEALRLGVTTLHTAVPPLANGSGQPSVLNVARNGAIIGYRSAIDEGRIRRIAKRLTSFAKQDDLPLGVPLEYDESQYIHQVPGGVISNLRFQLAELGMQHRLDEVLEEAVRVRHDRCYPIMITPHSQYVVTQAAINVAVGSRYELVIDELILFAKGFYGEDSGYGWMDQNLKDRILGSRRASEISNRKTPKFR